MTLDVQKPVEQDWTPACGAVVIYCPDDGSHPEIATMLTPSVVNGLVRVRFATGSTRPVALCDLAPVPDPLTDPADPVLPRQRETSP